MCLPQPLVEPSPRIRLLQSPAAKASTRKTSILSRIGAHQFQSSTKIEALREEIWAMRQRDPSAKAIVFSQFTSMLDLITYRFEQVGSSGDPVRAMLDLITYQSLAVVISGIAWELWDLCGTGPSKAQVQPWLATQTGQAVVPHRPVDCSALSWAWS